MGTEQWAVLPTILQGGSFAILAALFVWLMYWVPKWRTESTANEKAERESREVIAEAMRKAIEEIERAHDTRADKLVAAFERQQQYEREQCARQFTALEDNQRQHRVMLDQLVKAAGGDRK